MTASTTATTAAASTGEDPVPTGTEPALSTGPALTTGGSSSEPFVPCEPGECGEQTCHPELGICVACVTNDECKDTGLPHCDARSHECGPCVMNAECGGSSDPVCDLETGDCRPCRDHRDCEETACDLQQGTCFPVEQTDHLYVEAVNGCSDQMVEPMCSKDEPCCEIASALAGPLLVAPYVVVHVAKGSYVAEVRVDTPEKTIAVLADEGTTLSVMSAMPNTSAFVLSDIDPMIMVASRVFVSNLDVTGGNTSMAYSCDLAGLLWLDHSEVYAHPGYPMSVANCSVVLDRSQLRDNGNGVLAGTNAYISLRNTTSGNATAGAALQTAGNGILDVVYSTIGDPSGSPNRILTCVPGTNVTIRNSALLAAPHIAPPLGCVPVASHSAFVKESFFIAGDGNVGIEASEVMTALFVNFAGSDYNLAGDGGSLVDVARWQTGDPATDLNDALRPAVDPSPDVAGADLPGG
mgnify:CR=1 FL=1